MNELSDARAGMSLLQDKELYSRLCNIVNGALKGCKNDHGEILVGSASKRIVGQLLGAIDSGLIRVALTAPPNGNARESARDAGSDINKEVGAPDQGSVRNATDMRERCAVAIEKLVLPRKKNDHRDPEDELFFEFCDKAAAAIRALPDQKD